MSILESLSQAIIAGTREIFQTLEMGLENAPPKVVPSGSLHGQVTTLLTFREEISGNLCFKCSIPFGAFVCQKMIGCEGKEDDYALLKDAIAEVFNWISGAIKRHYAEGRKIIISTPMVYVMEEEIEVGDSDEESTCIQFFYEEEEFFVEILMNE